MAVDVVGSRAPQFPSQAKPDNTGYGQNGFQGPSSDLPGKRTVSGFLPEDAGIQGIIGDTKADMNDSYRAGRGDWQTRTVSAAPYTPHSGMKSPNKAGETVPPSTGDNRNRPVTRPASRTDFQR
jgi:hypothetical protein